MGAVPELSGMDVQWVGPNNALTINTQNIEHEILVLSIPSESHDVNQLDGSAVRPG